MLIIRNSELASLREWWRVWVTETTEKTCSQWPGAGVTANGREGKCGLYKEM